MVEANSSKLLYDPDLLNSEDQETLQIVGDYVRTSITNLCVILCSLEFTAGGFCMSFQLWSDCENFTSLKCWDCGAPTSRVLKGSANKRFHKIPVFCVFLPCGLKWLRNK